MNKNSGAVQRENELNLSLLHACQDIENPSTWTEVAHAALHCKTVKAYRLNDIKNKLKAGASPNAVLRDGVKSEVIGWTPFHWAVGNNSPELVALLLQYRADVNKGVNPIKKNSVLMTPFGMMIANNGFIASRAFNILSLRSKTAKPVSEETALRSNVRICGMLVNAGVTPQPGIETRFAAYAQMGGIDF